MVGSCKVYRGSTSGINKLKSGLPGENSPEQHTLEDESSLCVTGRPHWNLRQAKQQPAVHVSHAECACSR